MNLAKTIATIATAGALLGAAAPAAQASWISVGYGQRVMRTYINKTWRLDRGPYFSDCWKLKQNTVRCDVQFKAGFYWHDGRLSVRQAGGIDHITGDLPIS